jgi:hypothetical protein
MNRRLYFLFPDEMHARQAVDMLLDGTGVETRHIHAVAKDEKQLRQLPLTTPGQKHDSAGHLEHYLWNTNLGLFFVALALLVVALVSGSTVWMATALAVMVATFVGGLLFTQHLPHTHLGNFHAALARGEILVMVDVPKDQIHTVEQFIHAHYPEAYDGGVSWTVDAMGL